MTEFDIAHDGIKCSCCAEPIKLGIQHWLDIHAHTPHGDKTLLVLLYHNWVASDTAYLVFGQTYRILGLYPPDPLFMLLSWADEDDKITSIALSASIVSAPYVPQT